MFNSGECDGCKNQKKDVSFTYIKYYQPMYVIKSVIIMYIVISAVKPETLKSFLLKSIRIKDILNFNYN